MKRRWLPSWRGKKRIHSPRRGAPALLGAAPNPRPSGKKKMTDPKQRFAASINPDYMSTVIFDM
jgi:hypothetical protein